MTACFILLLPHSSPPPELVSGARSDGLRIGGVRSDDYAALHTVRRADCGVA
jgi:hypothetical protein